MGRRTVTTGEKNSHGRSGRRKELEDRRNALPLATDDLRGRATTLASISIFEIPLHIWNTDVAEEIATLWGTPGNCYKVRAVEDHIRSFGMAPNCSNMEQGQSSDEEWWDTDNEERGNEENMENYKEDEKVAKKHSEAGQAGEGSGFTNFGLQSKNEPNSISPKSKSKLEDVCGPIQKDLGAPVVPDLNNSPSSLGYFPFIENDENLEDNFDLGDEIEIEQEINEEIERKRRHKKKGARKSSSRWESQGGDLESDYQGCESSNSCQKEIDQTIRIGDELESKCSGSVI
ncbi:hypothetical protein L2E82_15844 [Cichorium intybus]|uniref:Uncharacterized protein n=1 Tax=Cichorium intybus TaxID=13427 RepID=A0ACB9F4H5_CICIN|nr:hypothetical protein L2E82_15844 [Cichorium intybus]